MNYLIVQLTREEAIIARFRRERGALLFTEAARHELPDDAALATLLAETAAAESQQPRVILAIPPGHLFMREIELPITDRRKLREILPLELKGETAIETEELVFDAVPLTGGKCLAIWGKRRELAERIRILKESGVEPEIVTASLFHWQELLPAAEEPLALTDGEALTVSQAGRLIFCRALGNGELSGELTATLAALEFGRGITVRRLFLHGGAARQPAPVIEGVASLPLPMEGALSAAFGGDLAAALDLSGAFAVAQAAAKGEPVNFRSGELAYTAGQQRLRRKLRLTLILAAAFLLLLFIETGLRFFLVKRDLDSLNASIRGIYRQVFPTRKKPVDEVGELRSEIKRLSGAAAGTGVLATLKKLAEIKGDEVSAFVETSVEGNQVRLQGDARSIQAVNDFRTRAAAIFTGAEVGEIKSRPDGSVTFVFRGTVKEEGK